MPGSLPRPGLFTRTGRPPLDSTQRRISSWLVVTFAFDPFATTLLSSIRHPDVIGKLVQVASVVPPRVGAARRPCEHDPRADIGRGVLPVGSGRSAPLGSM